jgi:hypothetical protein
LPGIRRKGECSRLRAHIVLVWTSRCRSIHMEQQAQDQMGPVQSGG